MGTLLLRGLLAAVIALGLGPVALATLRRARVMDYPSERSSHTAPMLRGGGVAPAAAMLLALAVTPGIDGRQRVAIAAAATTFGFVGLTEDLVGIDALTRLAVQFAAAVGTSFLLLAHLTGPDLWRAAFAFGVVVWLVAFVNAYNFMDGINGISVVQAVCAGGAWFFVGSLAGSRALAAGGAVVAGAALGFGPYNVPKARMFLGDAGSYFIGAWLAAVAVLGLRASVAPEAVLAPLALYAADTGATLLRRAGRGERWYHPHRDHAYQRLADGGWSHVRTSAFVGACIAACAALGAVSLTGSIPARAVADAAIAGVVGGYLLAPGRPAGRQQRLRVAR